MGSIESFFELFPFQRRQIPVESRTSIFIGRGPIALFGRRVIFHNLLSA
jgi:hypothetical protein